MKKLILFLLALALIGCSKNVKVNHDMCGTGTATVKFSNVNPLHYNFYIRIENETGSIVYDNTIKYDETVELELLTGHYEFCYEYKKKDAFWWPVRCKTKTLYPDKKLELNTYKEWQHQYSGGGGDPVRMGLDILGIFFR